MVKLGEPVFIGMAMLLGRHKPIYQFNILLPFWASKDAQIYVLMKASLEDFISKYLGSKIEPKNKS